MSLTFTVRTLHPRITMTARHKIVFQGEPGANSHFAAREVYPDYEPVPCATFEDAFSAITCGKPISG